MDIVDLYKAMAKECIFCSSKNVYQLQMNAIVCFDCNGIISNKHESTDIVYVSSDVDEVRDVSEVFNKLARTSMLNIVGFYVVVCSSKSLTANQVASVVCNESIDPNRLSILFNHLKFTSQRDDITGKLKQMGIINIVRTDTSYTCEAIGNSLSGDELMKVIALLILSGCRDIVFV